MENNGCITTRRRPSRKEAFFSENSCIEWRSLLEEARDIQSDSYTLSVLCKVCKFLFNEGNPVGLLILLHRLNHVENGFQAYIHIIINLSWSVIIAYYLCSEKREICKDKQGGLCMELVRDTFLKTLTLLIDWITECSRGKKRKKKIRTIEDHIYRTQTGTWSLKKEGCTEMTKFFSSHLRYLMEDILIASLRSFALVMFFASTMVDSQRKTLTICTRTDVFKLLFMIWTLWKISRTVKSFLDAKRMYYATVQLWASTWKSSCVQDIDSPFDLQAGHYNALQTFQKAFFIPWSVYNLDWFITFIVMASRFSQVLVLIVAANVPSAIMWCFLLLCLNLIMLDFFKFKFIGRFRTKFENPPSGYSRDKLSWIDRCTAVLVFDYGYSITYGPGKLFTYRAVFLVPSTIIFFAILYYSNGTVHIKSNYENMLSMHTIISNMSYVDVSAVESCASGEYAYSNVSTWNDMYYGLSSEPVDVFAYVGGVKVVVYATVVLGILGLILDVLYKILLCRENIDLQKFEGLPYLDAADFYRTLIQNVVGRESNNFISYDASNDEITQTITIEATLTNPLRSLMALTILNDREFDETWRSFPEYKSVNYNWEDKLIEDAASDFALTKKDWSYLLNQTNMENIIGISGHVSLNSIVLTNLQICDSWPSLNQEPILPTDHISLLINRMIEQFRNNDHPLEPYINLRTDSSSHSDSSFFNLLTKLFEKIQEGPEDQINYQLFIIFCDVLNYRLANMTSYRIERTFDMVKQKVSKTYEI